MLRPTPKLAVKTASLPLTTGVRGARFRSFRSFRSYRAVSRAPRPREERFMRATRCPLVRVGLVILGLLVVPTVASAQSAISGLVRDSTGAILPGVTVEATSPVLIEKVRNVVSDEQGRYTIVDLRPGTYSVTFSVTG